MSNYEEKYKRALNIMESVRKESNNKQLNDSIGDAFPELADSEDEKHKEKSCSNCIFWELRWGGFCSRVNKNECINYSLYQEEFLP